MEAPDHWERFAALLSANLMRTAPEIVRDRKGEVTMVSAYSTAEREFSATTTGRLAECEFAADSVSLPYSKIRSIPNNYFNKACKGSDPYGMHIRSEYQTLKQRDN